MIHVAVCVSLCALLAPRVGLAREGRFEISARFECGRAPHQIVFVDEGRTALVAASGSDWVARISVPERRVLETFEVPGTPLGVARFSDGRLAVSRFRSEGLTLLGDGQVLSELELGAGPSFLVGPMPGERFLVALERGDRLAVVGAEPFSLERTYPVGSRPFPPSATSDGRLAFVPNYDSGDVSVIDLWNERVYARVPVGEHPSGGAVLPDDIEYVVAVRGENHLKWINTAARNVVDELSEGIGDSPFSVVPSADGRLLFVNNTGSHDVSVVERATRRVIARVPVGEIPIAMAVTAAGDELWVACEGTHEVVVVRVPPIWRPVRQGQATTRTTGPAEVAVLGMIHGAHRTSELWGLDQVRETIRRLEPSAVLVEIPPDRWERIWRDFTERGVFEDERIALFPEYTDVLLPLALEQGFEIVPCAAWTREMADLRRARMASFESDEAFEAQRASYREAEARVAAELGDPPAREDDPQFIHSVEYDERTRKELGPYDEFMNEHIGPGGWTNINRAHMNLIEAAIEARRGQRLLITFGAGHKYWFLDALRENRGVRLIDVVPHLSGPEGGAGD